MLYLNSGSKRACNEVAPLCNSNHILKSVRRTEMLPSLMDFLKPEGYVAYTSVTF